MGEYFQSCLQEKKWESFTHSVSLLWGRGVCVRHRPRHRDEALGWGPASEMALLCHPVGLSQVREGHGDSPRGEGRGVSPVTPARKAGEILRVSNGPGFKPSERLSR